MSQIEQTTKKPGPAPGTRPKVTGKQLQQLVASHDPNKEQTVTVILRFDDPDASPNLELQLSVEAILAIIDPDVPDAFIKVPTDMPNAMKYRYLHTKAIKEVLFNQDLPGYQF